MEEAVKKYPDVDRMVNFASWRSVFGPTVEVSRFKQIRWVV